MVELISFPLCPFVQRSVILLKRKNVRFEVSYIDLEHPPAWFEKISPLGQVPLLRIENDVVFESTAICELVDEIYPPSLHPVAPVRKAKERAWVEASSALLMRQYELLSEPDSAALHERIHEFFEILSRIEPELGVGPFFRGSEFGFVDAAFAPLFMRARMLPEFWENADFEKLGKTRKWATYLLSLPEVKESVVPDFGERFFGMLEGLGGAIFDTHRRTG